MPIGDKPNSSYSENEESNQFLVTISDNKESKEHPQITASARSFI